MDELSFLEKQGSITSAFLQEKDFNTSFDVYGNGISRQSSILEVESHPSHASLRVGRVYRTDTDKQYLERILY